MTEQVQAGGTTPNTAPNAPADTTAVVPAQQAAAAPAAPADQAASQQAATPPGQGPSEPAAPAAPQGAPEKYEFSSPEGYVFDANVLTVFEASARKHSLTQEIAQDLLTSVGPAIAERQKAAYQEVTTKWAESSKVDKEFGGDKLTENLAIAEAGLEAHGTPELQAFLKESGLAQHPEMIRLFFRLGRVSSPDGALRQGNPVGTAKNAQAFFSSSQMNP